MKLFLSLILTLLVLGCSFDNKSGIWDNENDPRQILKKIFLQILKHYHQKIDL